MEKDNLHISLYKVASGKITMRANELVLSTVPIRTRVICITIIMTGHSTPDFIKGVSDVD